MSQNILDINTVELDEANNCVIIIDQTKLPSKTELINLKTAEEIWEAIYLLKVRGAPAIGVAAALGLYVRAGEIYKELTAEKSKQCNKLQDNDNVAVYQSFFDRVIKEKEYLNSSRPTAVNLSWALNRMEKVLKEWYEESRPVVNFENEKDIIEKCISKLYAEAKAIQKEDIDTCRKLGEYGLTLLKKGDGILTHCNAGQLATSKYGTATAPIYLGHEKGYNFKVFCDETRPLLQGARLTAYELQSAGVDVTLICDNMSAMVMRNGWVNAVFVGCDRVAANGDVANKIGTSVVATVAKRFNVPFYVCAPTSTIDLNTPTGNDIKIEERPQSEVTDMWYKERMAPENVKVFNPAFDVTDNEYVSAIITEYGIARAPYTDSLKEILDRKHSCQM